jgi:hypothetical protein
MLFYVFMCGERAVSTKNCLWKKNELDNMREDEKESRRLMVEKRNRKISRGDEGVNILCHE